MCVHVCGEGVRVHCGKGDCRENMSGAEMGPRVQSHFFTPVMCKGFIPACGVCSEVDGEQPDPGEPSEPGSCPYSFLAGG